MGVLVAPVSRGCAWRSRARGAAAGSQCQYDLTSRCLGGACVADVPLWRHCRGCSPVDILKISESHHYLMQYIYTMKGLGKVHPPDAVVLKDIWLSFLPGAKIGVLGLNGAGKSSLLKIMAGEDTEFIG